MSTVDEYIKKNVEIHQFAAEVARTSCNSNPGRDCVRMVANWSGCAE